MLLKIKMPWTPTIINTMSLPKKLHEIKQNKNKK